MSIKPALAFALATVTAATLSLHPGEAWPQETPGVALALDDARLRSGGIGFVEVRRERSLTELTFPGTIAIPPTQLKVVAAPAEGLVEAVYVAVDETVEEGQLLLKIRSPAFVELQREFISADADAGLARDWLRRAEQLAAAKALPERELRSAEVQARTTAFRFDERRHALKAAGMSEIGIERLRTTREYDPVISIHSPGRGVVINRHTTTGDRVASAESLLTIARLEPLWVNLQVPAGRVGLVPEGARVTLSGYGAGGRILRIARQVDPATQSVSAIAEIDANGGSVRPGLAVVATVSIEPTNTAQWVVPSESVVRHNGRSWIFVRNDTGVRATPVDVLAENARESVVGAPLSDRDRIANRGIIALLAELAKLDKE